MYKLTYGALFLCTIGLMASSCFASPLQQTRYRRQVTATGTEEEDSGNFGAGAAAGIGGLGRSAGIGSFSANPRTNPYNPFGAFAGLNLGQGGDGDKLGAGCSGLNCGFQLGNLALSTRQLFDAFTNGTGNSDGGFDPFRLLQQPINMFRQFQTQYQPNQAPPHAHTPDQDIDEQQAPPPSISEFARIGNNNNNRDGNNNRGGLFSGGAFSSIFGSRNGNRPLFQSTSVHVDQDGKVTTVERGTGMEDKIGRIDGDANGVFAASGTKMDPDGSVTSFRNVGSLH